MPQLSLTEVVTKDKLVHQGLFYKPFVPHFAKASRGRALLWVHGLTDNFYGDLTLMEELSVYCEKEGWGLASFNNRGHDIITSLTKVDTSQPKGYAHATGGAGVEKFTDCVLDIRAGIDFLEKQGFPRIVLAGISTGANKVCYYAGTKEDPRVAGVILVSPISDVAIKMKELGNRYSSRIKKAQNLVKQMKGESLFEGFDWMPLTPKRFLSLYQQGSPEDVFPYYQKNPELKTLAKITIPLMVVLGGADEYSERSAAEIIRVFKKYQNSSNFKSVIIPGGFHSFAGTEKVFTREVINWIKQT